MRKILYATSALAIGLAFASTAEAQIVTNGNFADGLNGWTATGSVVAGTTAGNTGAPFTPGTLADFGSGSTTGGRLMQTIVTVPGTNYILSFLYGAFGSGAQQQLSYTILNGTVTTRIAVGSPDTDYNFIYSPFSAAFKAVGTSVTLSFVDTTLSANAANADGVLTSVKVANIPEPVSMAVLGAGVLGLAAVRRRRAV